jgi:hypothetical protein
MIRRNNPAIDFDGLERRVREVSATIGHPDVAVRKRGEDPLVLRARKVEQMAFVRELLADVERRLEENRHRAASRLQLPARLRVLGPLGAPLIAAYNYLFKTQREIDAEFSAALRATAEALRVMLDLFE